MIAGILFSFWDPISKAIIKWQERKLAHPSLRPINGLHPAIFSIGHRSGQGLKRIENYGIERWSLLPNGRDRLWLSLYFERPTGIERIEVTNLHGRELFAKREVADNRTITLGLSRRILEDGVRVKCFNIGDTRHLARGEFVPPQLPPNTEA